MKIAVTNDFRFIIRGTLVAKLFFIIAVNYGSITELKNALHQGFLGNSAKLFRSVFLEQLKIAAFADFTVSLSHKFAKVYLAIVVKVDFCETSIKSSWI